MWWAGCGAVAILDIPKVESGDIYHDKIPCGLGRSKMWRLVFGFIVFPLIICHWLRHCMIAVGAWISSMSEMYFLPGLDHGLALHISKSESHTS